MPAIIMKYIRAFVIIYVFLYLGLFIAPILPVAIPGSILGLIILFVLLSFQIIPERWVNPGCTLLVRYMALLFVPIGAGVIQYTGLLRAQFGLIFVSCLGSTIIVMVVVSYTSHLVHNKHHAKEKS